MGRGVASWVWPPKMTLIPSRACELEIHVHAVVDSNTIARTPWARIGDLSLFFRGLFLDPKAPVGRYDRIGDRRIGKRLAYYGNRARR